MIVCVVCKHVSVYLANDVCGVVCTLLSYLLTHLSSLVYFLNSSMSYVRRMLSASANRFVCTYVSLFLYSKGSCGRTCLVRQQLW